MSIRAINAGSRDGRDYTVHPPYVRQYAYELWLFQCGRDCVKTHQALASKIQADPDWHRSDVPLRTVQSWASGDKWPEKAADTIASLSESMYAEAAGNMVINMLEASRQLTKLIRGEFDWREAKGISEGIKLALDRTGWDPENASVTMGKHVRRAGGKMTTMKELLALSPDELTAWASTPSDADPDTEHQ